MGELDDEACRRHVARIDWHRAVVIGCFVGRTLRGVAELHPEGGATTDLAEAAFTVERAYQNHGIATALMQRLLTMARNRTYKHVYLLCLIDNVRIRKVARKFGASLKVDYGDATADLSLMPPTPMTFLQESLEEGWSLVARMREAAKTLLPAGGWMPRTA